MASWLLWLLVAATLAVGVFLLWYLVAGGSEELDADGLDASGRDPLSITAAEGRLTDPLATTAEEQRGVSRKSRMIKLRESLERSLDSREGIRGGSAKDRMIMPWFLLVGADGSGKKTILANTGLELPWGPPIEVDSQRKDAGKWWLFDDAVVLEAPAASPGTTEGSSTLPPDQTVVDSSIGWSTLLHMLRRERPDSPLNGIIVTVSCTDLVGAAVDPDRLEDQANRIRIFLERTRRFLGVRLPLHVIVTKCDSLPGFRSFAQALPEARRQDIFGWANPNDPEAKFEPTWVDHGFVHLRTQLADLRDEVLAASEEVRDSVGVFVFDSEFADLQEPLKAFVARLMTIGERRPSLFFRGFYVTGDAPDASAPSSGALATTLVERRRDRSSRTSDEIADDPHNLVFLRSVFADKIFKEAGLARAATRLRLARDRRVVLAQAAALVLAIGGGFGLWTTVNGFSRDGGANRAGLRTDAAVLTRVLSGIAIDLDAVRRDRAADGNGSPLERRSHDAAVIELVGQMRDVPPAGVRSAFLPTSWFSSLPGDIRASLRAGAENIVLPVIRQRLLERADRLVGSGDANAFVPDELDAADPRSIIGYLDAVRELGGNIERYNALADTASGSVADLSELIDYLFGERVIADSEITPDFEQALRRASGPRIAVSAGMAGAVVRRAAAMVSDVAGASSRQLAPRVSEAATRAIRPEADLAALDGLGALVELLDPQRGIVASVGDSAILGARLARLIQDSIAAQIQLAAVRIAPDTLAPDSSARRLRNVVSQLYQFRLMRRIEGLRVASEPRPDERLLWDVGSLELALSLRGEFLQAVVATTVAFPEQSPERLQRALEVQLRHRTVDVAASAQRFTRLGDIEDPFAEVRALGANLESATSRIVRLALLLDTIGAGAHGRNLLVAGVRQAEQALAIAQRTLERNRYLAPVGSGIVGWQGVLPFKFAALGTTDSLAFGTNLLRAETEIRTLAHDLRPSLRFLRLDPVADAARAATLLDAWEQILVAVLKYERGDLSSTMGTLHRFIVSDLSVSDLESCRVMAEGWRDIGPSTDLFVTRLRQFRAALASRCVAGASGGAAAEYQRLRQQFQARLSGRYPFVEAGSRTRVDAVAADVRDFMRRYEDFAAGGEVALRSDPRLVQTGRAALLFLEQLGPVRDLLTPFAGLDASRPVPEYDLVVATGASRDSMAQSRLVLRVGSRYHHLTPTPQATRWRAGDSVSVVIEPYDAAEARTEFSAGGVWAALRAAADSGSASIRLFHPDSKLGLSLPAFPTAAPEILNLRR